MKRGTKMLLTAPAAIVFCLGTTVYAQTAATEAAVSANKPKAVADAPAAKTFPMPAMTEYRKAGIGAVADDLRKAWGKPEVEDKDGYIYEFDKEMAQVAIDADKKVDTIAVTFRDSKAAPKAEDVFGPSEKIQRKENGSVFHMVRYPEAGYWVSYLSQGDGKPVILTFKKL